MNVTELARMLKITPQELLDKLPLLGIDVGKKAIKVDNRMAQYILRNWSMLNRRLEMTMSAEKKAEEAAVIANQEKKVIFVPPFITVRDFAALAGLPINRILSELIKNSIFASLNERIDFDTASIIGADLGLDVQPPADTEAQTITENVDKIKQHLGASNESQFTQRPPVVVVVGHVDHGKTKLLDAIRHTDVVAGEAGGITQSIGAYQIKHNEKLITFIDTPGHEAFTAMRNRGAKVADIGILVVAADDGVKPQTVEAYRILEAAKLPFIVAINKIDKPGADINKTKQELSTQLNIIPEDWGGKIVCAQVSAKLGQGIDELLDLILLTAELSADSLKANVDTTAIGTVVEARVDKGEGPIATILVQNGTLKIGDDICFNNLQCGRVRALKNYLGANVPTAGPSTPVKIIGLKMAPTVGDVMEVGAGAKVKFHRQDNGAANNNQFKLTSEEAEDPNAPQINLVIKSDTLGSGEAIEGSLLKIDTQGVKIKIALKGLGNISEGDIDRASAIGGQVVGFNVRTNTGVNDLIRSKKVRVKMYTIIYELIADIKAQIQELVKPEIQRVALGKLKVLAIFRTENKFQIIGGKVTSGKAANEAIVEVWRDSKLIAVGKVSSLQAGKQEVPEVDAPAECGMKVEGQAVIAIGDELDFFKENKIFKTIK